MTLDVASSVNFIDGTIPPVSEIVIVIADLYLPAGSTDAAGDSYATGFARAASSSRAAGNSPPPGTSGGIPALEHIARFGHRRALAERGGWRGWLAHRLDRDDLVNVPPAVIAAAALDTVPSGPTTSGSAASGSAASGFTASSPAVSGSIASGSTAWLATPLHRIAGLTSVHLDRRSLLQLSAEEVQGFVTDFNRIFGDDPTSPLCLRALPGGALLLEAPANLVAATTDPARALVTGLEDSLPSGPQATPFKLLGAEIEMWLHPHPLNAFRAKRGDLPVNALWLWGGGPVTSVSQPETTAPASSVSQHKVSVPAADAARLFGSDPFLAGLSRLSGLPLHPLPPGFRDIPDVADNERTLLVTEIAPWLHSNPTWSVFDVMAELDRCFISPALAALNTGAVERLTLIANDVELSVQRRDRLKFWRRPKTALAGLQ